MSTRLPPSGKTIDSDTCTSSSTGEDDDQNWDDWVSDSHRDQECQSLFDDVKLPVVEEVVSYDKEKHGFDLYQVCSKLGA